MPAYDLRHIQAAKYTKSDSGNTVTYSDVTKVGDAMTANFELRNAEGRLYAESSLAEYMRKATGGTISLGVKYITEAAQVLLYKAVKTTRSVKTKSISVVRYGKTSTSQYVGVSFYAPDMIDGVEKFTCISSAVRSSDRPAMSTRLSARTSRSIRRSRRANSSSMLSTTLLRLLPATPRRMQERTATPFSARLRKGAGHVLTAETPAV